MNLADFIRSNSEPILNEWESFARSIGAGEHLNELALRDHAEEILHATVRDMTSSQSPEEQTSKSKGQDTQHEKDALEGASDAHALGRLSLGFDMLEVMSEYRALRASVLRLWHESEPRVEDLNVNDLTRFNESIDESISIALTSYTKRVDQARDMFLAILSHDLRNPLGAISMTATVIPVVSDDKAEVSHCVSEIAHSASVMERMIADLLDYTRTRLGAGMPVNPVPMNMGTLGQEVIEEFQAAHRNREIVIRKDGDLNGLWDYDRIRQAISNLIGNAIQHGSTDSPVNLSISGHTSKIVVEVQNGGDPIPAGELPRIFDPLIRGSSAGQAKTNRPGSIGMGLYIAREVTKSHGGRVDVSSTVQDGTSFKISLPRESAPKVGQPILDSAHIQTM